jgi:predicted tellurium resistance membrane protein TerC
MKIGKIVVGLILIAVAIWMAAGMETDNAMVKYLGGGIVAIIGIALVAKALMKKKGAAPTKAPPTQTPPTQTPPTQTQ